MAPESQERETETGEERRKKRMKEKNIDVVVVKAIGKTLILFLSRSKKVR